MKVFYKTVIDPSELLEKQSNNIEELQLPNCTMKTLQADLQTSTNILPQPARVHHEWTIGLLDRWNSYALINATSSWPPVPSLLADSTRPCRSFRWSLYNCIEIRSQRGFFKASLRRKRVEKGEGGGVAPKSLRYVRSEASLAPAL